MNQQDYITLFTVRIGAKQDANIKLFYNNKEKYVKIDVIDELLSLLSQNKTNNEEELLEVRKSCFNSMSLEDKIAAIKNHYLSLSRGNAQENTTTISPEEKVERLISNIDNIPSFVFKDKDLWGTQKMFIYENAGPRYSLYKAIKHNNVFAIDILTKKRGEKEWISGLFQFAKRINPGAKIINLIIHQGDILEDHDYYNYSYIFTAEEIKNIIGETTDISVNVMAFSHTSECPIYLVLRGNYENKDKTIPKEIDSVHSKISYIANEDREFRKKLSQTINGIKGGVDPIGKSYK